MLKFWLFLFLFSTNRVKNEKCCDAKTQTHNEENDHRVVRLDSTYDCIKPKLNPELSVLDMTKTSVKDEPTIEEDKKNNLVNAAPLNKNINPLPIKKPIITSQRPTTIKLTKGGTKYFFKKLEESINKHPILSKNSKVIIELLNEAIDNATIAVVEQQQKETVVPKEHIPARIVISKPPEGCESNSTIQTVVNAHIEMKEKATQHTVIELPHKRNMSQVIVCDDGGEKIKVDSSVVSKHDGGNKHVHLTDKSLAKKHEEPCPTKSYIAGIHPDRQIFEVEIKNEPTSGQNKLQPIKISKVDHIKLKEKLISLLKPKLTTTLVDNFDCNEIELPLFYNETEEKLPSITDIEDKICEETYNKRNDDAKYSSYSNLYPQGWYTNYQPNGKTTNNYQTYGQYPTYTETTSYNSPTAFYSNPCAYTVKQYDANNNLLSYEQNCYAYKNFNNALIRQKEHNDLLKRLWWNRKIHFNNGVRMNNKPNHKANNLSTAKINPNYDHVNLNCFKY